VGGSDDAQTQFKLAVNRSTVVIIPCHSDRLMLLLLAADGGIFTLPNLSLLCDWIELHGRGYLSLSAELAAAAH